ncbi:MAG TPA: heterocyst frequency control protein PatD [Synechococcales cyanobacterium M55_K2018_004]|nr:heterocyst frequency control protein PatD [Synechococcales cyanobacterium M55_K2018_004]
MLPEIFRHEYKIFQRSLQSLQGLATLANPDIRAVQAAVLESQQLFQTCVLPLDLELVDGAIAPRLQSIQTEIGKQLRLLGMDVTFWQTARQPITLQQRQQQVCERIALLQQYCAVVLEE